MPLFRTPLVDIVRCRDLPRLRPDDRVSAAIHRMTTTKNTSVLICDSADDLLGLFDERALLTRVIGPGREPAGTRLGDVMTPEPAVLEPQHSLHRALTTLARIERSSAPVVDRRRQVIGLLTAEDIMERLCGLSDHLEVRTVAQIDRRTPVVCSSGATVREVVARLVRRRRGHCIIRDEHGRVVGVFTETDLTRRVDLSVPGWRTLTVDRFVTPSPSCVMPNTRLAVAAEQMRHGQCRHLPVVNENGVLLGTLSISDLVCDLARALPEAGFSAAA